MATDSDKSWGPNLIKAFRDAGVITEAKFAFYLAGVEDLSYLDVGFFREDGMRDPSNLQMIDILKNNFWWAQSITGIKF